jgi:hypothetical protein
MSASTKTTIQNPGKFEFSPSVRTGFVILAVVGIVTFLAGLKISPERAWTSFVINHFYFMSLALGGLFFASIQWITSAMWSAPVRRLAESFTAYLPVVLVTFAILCLGVPKLYSWSHAEHVVGDLVLEGKSGYLSVGFFIIRNVLAIGVWLFFGFKMIRNSLAQDKSGDYALTVKNRMISPIFLILFGVLYTMASFDQLMSLDPHWFSTIFGVYCFAGLFYIVLAFTAIMTVYMLSRQKLTGIVNDNHLHDLGKFMFAFTIFWAYIAFSQFMLIWYANLPEETGYYLHRFHGDWKWVSLFLLIGKFMVPFFILLPREAKRNPRILLGVGIFMLIAHWIDLMWIVQPEFFSDGPRFGWAEIGITLGFIGIFGFTMSRFLARNNIVAIGDPRLAESVFHFHQ